MARSFRELGKKAEDLIEQGKEAQRDIQSCQARVGAASGQVAAALAELRAASETDENGSPKGDPAQAQARLNVARNQLAASQRALDRAREEERKIKEAKSVHAREIEKHNQAERSNLQKLKRLKQSAFAGDSAPLTRGMAERLNEAEDARVALLQSMGLKAEADYVSVAEEYTEADAWTGGGFAALDLQPVQQPRQENQTAGPWMQGAAKGVMQLSAAERYQMGLRYMDELLEAYRDNLRAREISDGQAMEQAMQELQGELLRRLSADIENGTYDFYDHPTPDFDKLADKIRADYAQHPPQYRMNDLQRERIRREIREGTFSERDLRGIGREMREMLERVRAEGTQALDGLGFQREQLKLAAKMKKALTKEERERLNVQRRILVEQENLLSKEYTRANMMRKVLCAYRPVGPKDEDSRQSYVDSNRIYGASKVIKAINHVREYLPTDWVERSNQKPIKAKHVNRGFFLPGEVSDTIALSGKDSMERCAFHEMGHRIENMYPEVLEMERQFYERRTSGENLEWLGHPYGKKEVTRFDNFIHPYMGKDYGGKGYELLSMGLESVFHGTYNLSRDPEYEDFILGILAIL